MNDDVVSFQVTAAAHQEWVVASVPSIPDYSEEGIGPGDQDVLDSCDNPPDNDFNLVGDDFDSNFDSLCGYCEYLVLFNTAHIH